MTLLSIIIPVYNEEENIHLLCNELVLHCGRDYEVIFVNDGSTDNTLAEIEKIINNNKCFKCLSLSRNFGHQNALMAGMAHAAGQKIIIMDGDLQHPPLLIPLMARQLDNGFDLVVTKRNKTENIGPVKKIMASLFYSFINIISDTKIEANVADFKAFNSKVLASILQFKERDLFLRGIFSWIGYKTTTINFDAPARKFGETKYSFGKMLKLALKGTTSFSFKPLRVALLVGSFISLFAFAFGVFALISYFKGNTVPGWASIIIAIMFLGGTQLLAIGLLGEYIASLFTEAKHRPLYLVEKKLNIA
ncbi:glycosyltransferase family 2 protein [Ferruginibacter paludis]|uniref:glycosyltransferase family 2 protein n=1 Tax=Ferruginibacter paludis TaxID=1310417 RepID=UPI0025B40863|nr:glycosyltransferase family 2 protein [Ferruginibacter paludis]MDN3654983.1 glycosyltransferase family 2 protein [Ferruginibacter paludis]